MSGLKKKEEKVKQALAEVPDGVTVGPTASSAEPIMFGRGSIRQPADSVGPLAWVCASHSGSLFTVKEVQNLILPHHAI